METITRLNLLPDTWGNIKGLIPYGAGLDAYRTLGRIIKDFDVPFIVDKRNDIWGKNLYGIPIKGPEALSGLMKGYKIIITIARRRYAEIKQELQRLGFAEYEDFCHISQFAVEWYYKYKGEYCIFSMDMAITTACTFRCKNCNMFIPYHKEKSNYSFAEMQTNFDLFFGRTDYLFTLGLLGGEPLLNPDLGRIVEYLCEKYSQQLGSISITTNGSIVPCQNLLDIFRDKGIIVIISDYMKATNCDQKIFELEELLKTNQILYRVRRDLTWCDFGFPQKPWQLDKTARQHMLECDPGWRGLNDSKFYFCNVAWSADRAGLYALEKQDYINLTELEPNNEKDKSKLLKYSLGLLENGCMSFCKVCGGCGPDNKSFVEAGEQIKLKNN